MNRWLFYPFTSVHICSQPFTGFPVALIDPIRYRGYYYDTESGLYYLQSRYYDPTTGRFVNADALAYTTSDSFIGLNLFAYTSNNFVNRSDVTGDFEEILIPTALLAFGVTITLIIVYNCIASVINYPGFQNELNRGFNNAIDNLRTLCEAISKGVANLVRKTKTIINRWKNKYEYWTAVLIGSSTKNGTYIPVYPLSYKSAISYVRSGGSVFASSRQKAYRLAKAVGNGREPQEHPTHKNGKEGYFRHYHAVSKKSKRIYRRTRILPMIYFEYEIDFNELSRIYNDLIKYATDKYTYISFITYQEKPYSKRPPICYHDKLTERLFPFLVKQHVGIRKWANGGTNDNHLVMNIYKIEPGIRKRMLEIGNLFFSLGNDLPFDLCIYREKDIWLSTICHEELASIYNPSENDMKFFKDHGIDLSLWGKFDYPPFKLDLSKNPD